MFTAASASVVYLSFGGIPFDYGLATFLSGLLWTILGQVGTLAPTANAALLLDETCI